jgi:hypothetical protein
VIHYAARCLARSDARRRRLDIPAVPGHGASDGSRIPGRSAVPNRGIRPYQALLLACEADRYVSQQPARPLPAHRLRRNHDHATAGAPGRSGQPAGQARAVLLLFGQADDGRHDAARRRPAGPSRPVAMRPPLPEEPAGADGSRCRGLRRVVLNRVHSGALRLTQLACAKGNPRLSPGSQRPDGARSWTRFPAQPSLVSDGDGSARRRARRRQRKATGRAGGASPALDRAIRWA